MVSFYRPGACDPAEIKVALYRRRINCQFCRFLAERLDTILVVFSSWSLLAKEVKAEFVDI